jgi:preprotein translocase subunit SecF
MEIIKPGTRIDFVGKRNIAYIFSLIMIVISIFSLLLHGGPKLGVDFAGGTVIQIQTTRPVTIDSIRQGLDTVDLGGSAVQQFGPAEDNAYLIRASTAIDTGTGFADELKAILSGSTGTSVDIQRVEMVGPQVGKDLRAKALYAMFYALIFIAIYISGRFEMKWALSAVMALALTGAVYVFSLFNVSIPALIIVALVVTLLLFWQLRLRYAMGAIVALIHDVIVTVGIFSLLDIELTLTVVAALLTIVGYSLNDNIIVFDRIRENQKRSHRLSTEDIINRSVNETLSRTILTSLTTLIVVMCLYFLGGDIIHDFARALMLGIMIGTYSSIYVASPVLLFFRDDPVAARA